MSLEFVFRFVVRLYVVLSLLAGHARANFDQITIYAEHSTILQYTPKQTKLVSSLSKLKQSHSIACFAISSEAAMFSSITSLVKNALSPDNMARKTKAGTKRRSAAASDAAAGRSKRARTNPLTSQYEPEDFTMKEAEGIKIIKGRGQKLGSFPEIKASVEASKRTHDEISFAHQFLFGKKGGKLSKKEMKDHILEFSGYLKPIPSGKKRTDKEVDKEEELAEVRYSPRKKHTSYFIFLLS